MPTLEWIGKSKVISHHQDVPFRVLERKYSFDENGQHSEDNGSENMIIRGDNLEALKALLPRYEGRVKCIYIDPPYNTGNEGWVYNDNVNDPKIKRWLGEVVGKEGEDLTRHDKWLCMMYPRLKLLQKLLADDGAIFISIDDAEFFNLRSICNEVFGEQNFIATVIWRKNYAPKSTAKHFSEDHDYTKDFRTHKSVKNTDLNMYFKENHHTAIIKKEDWIKVQKLLSERHSTAERATLRRLSNHFVAYRVKDGLFKGYLIIDSRWSFMERQEFMKIVDEAQNTMK